MIFMKISIITASYNYAQYIEETINSVISQSYQDWEMIIVDDGSSDNSVEIIKSFCEKDSRIKLLQHEGGQNKGLKETVLLGLNNATGDWIAFLESDDVFSPENLSKKIEIIEKHPDVAVIFNRVKLLEENINKNPLVTNFEKKQAKLSRLTYPRNMFYDFYINNMILTFSCIMVKADVLKNTDFSTPADRLLDWWLWIHIAYENKFYYINEELSSWRLHEESYIKTGKKPILLPMQVYAYRDIYNKNGKPVKLLLFSLLSNVKLFFVLGFRFYKNRIEDLKKNK